MFWFFEVYGVDGIDLILKMGVMGGDWGGGVIGIDWFE